MTPVILLLLSGCTCNQEASSPNGPAIPDFTSEEAKNFYLDRQKDSLPSTKESELNDIEKARRIDTSPFVGLSDEKIDGVIQGWVSGFRRTCDSTTFYKQWDQTKTDGVLQLWKSRQRESYIRLRNAKNVVQDSCENVGRHSGGT